MFTLIINMCQFEINGLQNHEVIIRQKPPTRDGLTVRVSAALWPTSCVSNFKT